MAARQMLVSLLLCLAWTRHTTAFLVVPRGADLRQAYLAGRSFAEQQISLNTNNYQPTEFFKAGEYTKHEQDGEICKTYGERQWAGTVDVTDQRRLFYWFFDSRNDPENDPVILWLNGGPGGSSMMGLFTEMGPCSVTKDSSGTVPNPHSWNNNASVLFIDQPAGTGFSSVTKGAPYPSTDEEAAVDLAFFFNTFFAQIFPDRAKLPLHIAGESYGGHYVPTFVDHVLADRARNSRDAYNGDISSIILINAIFDMTAPAVGAWELLCSNFRGQIFNETVCDKISAAMPECEQLGRDCRRTNDGYICLAARMYCEDAIESFYQAEEEAGNKSRYNIHLPCTNRPFCWDETIGNYSTYVSQPKALKALHFPPDFHFQAVNLDLNFQFALSTSLSKTRYPHMTRILESNIPVLALNGNEDFIVNTPGQIWSYDSLPWSGQTEYRTAQWKTWGDGQGIWKQSKDKRLVFVGIDGAGHAAPGDQGELTSDIVRQWIAGWNTEY